MDDRYDFKKIRSLWSLVDPLSVEQAAALIAGVDPNSISRDGEYFQGATGDTDADGIGDVKTAMIALVNAINAGTLPADIRRDAWVFGWGDDAEKYDEIRPGYVRKEQVGLDEFDGWPVDERIKVNANGIVYRANPNWGLTTVACADLKNWLRSKGLRDGFFFPDRNREPDYLNRKDARYAPKLAAAVNAWLAVREALPKKSPKQSLEKWLKEHAAEFGLVDDDGKPVTAAMQECSAVANWNTSGGATKTPGE